MCFILTASCWNPFVTCTPHERSLQNSRGQHAALSHSLLISACKCSHPDARLHASCQTASSRLLCTTETVPFGKHSSFTCPRPQTFSFLPIFVFPPGLWQKRQQPKAWRPRWVVKGNVSFLVMSACWQRGRNLTSEDLWPAQACQ